MESVVDKSIQNDMNKCSDNHMEKIGESGMDKSSGSGMVEINETEDDGSFETFVNWLEKGMNMVIDPCEDFLEYATGQFKEENYEKSRGEYPPYLDGATGIFEDILENENVQGPLIQKVRDFQRSIPDDPRIILRDEGMIEFCGGFPAFSDNWSAENFDWIKAAGILAAMGVEPILQCYVLYSDDSRYFFLRIKNLGPEGLEYAEDLLRTAELSEEQIYEIINDVNIIKEEIDRVTPESYGSDDSMIRIDELRNFAFDFQLFFDSWFGQPLRDDDNFTLYSQWANQFDVILNIFENAPPKRVANYMTFKVLDIFPRYRDLTSTHFSSVLLSVGFDIFWNEVDWGKRLKALEIFKSSFKRFCEEHRYDEAEFDYRLNDRDDEVLDFINSFFRREQVEKEYENVDISDNFVQNVINISRLEAPLSLRKCIEYGSESWKEEIFQEAKCILKIGVRCWKKPMMYHFSVRNARKWKHLFTILSFTEGTECPPTPTTWIKNVLTEQIISLIGYEDSFDVFGYIPAIEALRRSYNDYKSWLDENEDEARKQDKILARLNLNSRTAFFVSSAQRFCNLDVSYRNAFVIALLNCEEFAKEFKCKPNSRMNPKNRCIIKWCKRGEEEEEEEESGYFFAW